MVLTGTSFLLPPSVVGNDHPDDLRGTARQLAHPLQHLPRQQRGPRLVRARGSSAEAQRWRTSPRRSAGCCTPGSIPAHDNQLGVFGMWNESITPRDGCRDTIRATRQVTGSDFPEGAEQSLITDFLYTGGLERGEPVQSLFFNNVDSVPHTVTVGDARRPGAGRLRQRSAHPRQQLRAGVRRAGRLLAVLQPAPGHGRPGHRRGVTIGATRPPEPTIGRSADRVVSRPC